MNSAKRDILSGSRAVVAILFLLIACSSVITQPFISNVGPPSSQTVAATLRLTREDELFLEDLERRSFQYFWAEADPQTGLVPDRARMDGSGLDQSHHNVASIAATGFSLTALCIAAERGFIDRAQARERTRKTLRFFADRAFQERGWFYHWMDAKTGERRWQSEVS